ncbi:hypothetical protein [Nocardiopsis sp. CNT312]|uniref:hypothetical protein n=1 Tax=Nocardiopsis sp. CNT312 TaxID=1137268 RepID=UPI0004B73379|nr:hypothetical protein [Nocardiopsis sp. CNT312]
MSGRTPRFGGTHNTLDGGVRGPVIQAGRIDELHQHVAAGPPRPLEVPSPPADFVNHEAAVGWVRGLLDPDAPPRVVVWEGPLGIGKSSLLRKIAYATESHFTGGQLTFEYGRGVQEDSAAALAQFLRSLGVAKEALPADPGDWPGEYRTRTRGLRLLVVVEGAWEPAQVRALIPSGPGSLVLVSGDGPDLGELTIDAQARIRDLEPLQDGAARTLLGKLADRDLSAEDPAAVARLLEVCGGLPLALVLVAAQLARMGPGGAGSLAARVRDARTGLRAIGDGRGNLSLVFQDAYGQLSSGAAGLYRALGVWPGPDLDRSVVGAVGEEGLVDELVAANLITHDGHGALRFRHELIRAHARERVEDEEGEERGGWLRRMLDAYMTALGHAELLVRGPRLRVVDLDALLDGTEDPFAGSAERARVWLLRQRATLMAVVLGSHDAGLWGHTWRLAELASALYLDQRFVHDWAVTGETGADAARMAGEAAAEARLSSLVSRPLRDLARDGKGRERARARITRALELVEPVDDELLRGSVWEFYGRYLEQEDPEGAIAAFDRSLGHNKASDAPESERGAALALLFRGGALATAGRTEQAVADIEAALGALLALPQGPDRRMAARARVMLGRACADAGRDRDAAGVLSEALEELTSQGLGYYAAEAHAEVADVLGRLGDPRGRREHLERARDLYLDAGSPRARALTRTLEDESEEG